MAAAVPELSEVRELQGTAAMVFLQDRAYELAKKLARSQLEEVRAAVGAGEAETVLRGLRHRALQTLRRLRPRAEGALSAIRLPTGEVTTDMGRAAPVLVRHWSQQFAAKGTDDMAVVSRWCEHMPKFPEVMPRCEVSLDHVRRAVKAAGTTAPGPDGIPYAYWKGMGETGITVLYDTLQTMMEDD